MYTAFFFFNDLKKLEEAHTKKVLSQASDVKRRKKMITSRHKCLSAWNLYFYACILSFQMMTSHIHKEYLWKHYWILLFTRVFSYEQELTKKKALGEKIKEEKAVCVKLRTTKEFHWWLSVLLCCWTSLTRANTHIR